nr:MAG TPA: hypothetical protein [Bacteriophage sp.]
MNFFSHTQSVACLRNYFNFTRRYLYSIIKIRQLLFFPLKSFK